MLAWLGRQAEAALSWYAALDRRGRVHFLVVTVLVAVACALLSVRWSVPAPWECAAGRRLADPSAKYRADDYIHIYLWWGAIGAGLALLLIAALSPWWFRWSWGAFSLPRPSERVVFDLDELGWLLLVMVVAVALRVGYLGLPVLWDEQDNLRRNYHGYTEIDPSGGERWKPARLRDALWENERANNPFLYSVACQASMGAWRRVTGADRALYSVVAMRLPSLLAGVASLAALWWLAKLLGLRRAAPLAALLGALHCLHVEYSFQARGYGFVVLFVPLATGFALLGMRDGLWRWWVGYAASIFCVLHAFPGALYFAFALGVGVAVALAWRWLSGGGARERAMLIRFLTVNVFAGLIYAVAVAPAIRPALDDLSSGQGFGHRDLPLKWYFLAWNNYMTGTRFPGIDSYDAIGPGWEGLWRYLCDYLFVREPGVAFLSLVASPLLVLIGMWAVVRRAPLGGLWVGVGVAAPALAAWHERVTHLYIYWWYFIYALPFVLLFAAAGLVEAGRLVGLLGVGRWRRLMPYALGVTCALLFHLATRPPGMARLGWLVPGGRGARAGESRESDIGRQPRMFDWKGEGADRREEFPRGRSLWITYRDGRHVKLRDHLARGAGGVPPEGAIVPGVDGVGGRVAGEHDEP